MKMNMSTKIAETQNADSSLPVNRTARRTTRAPARRKPSATKAAGFAESALALQLELDGARREHGKLQQAIYEAAQVQRRLCAPRELAWGEFEIAGESFPVRHLSGDFFKVMELGCVLGLALGDIAGKGLSAGIWQAHLMDLIQRCARNYLHPADAVAGVNRELCQDLGEPPITALFFARLDPERNELVYCNAGLPPPLLMRRDKSIEHLEAGGPMLGAMEEATYVSGNVRLDAGDMLLAYSDGLTECRNSKEEEFETRRLSAAAKAGCGTTANQVLFSTLATVLDFADTCPPEDDLTLLVVRRCEAVVTEPVSTAGAESSMARRRVTSGVRSRQVSSRQEITANN
jgi:serine phosphatase RsbU (regulator of sigma subunit)